MTHQNSSPEFMSNLPIPVTAASAAVRPDKLPIQISEIVADRYEIKQVISSSAYLAFDRVACREVRLVCLSREQSHELEAWRRLPAVAHVVRLLDVTMTARGSFVIMENWQGDSLRSLQNQRKTTEQRFTMDEIQRWCEELTYALEMLAKHNCPVRINLETVAVTSDGSILLTDQALSSAGTSDQRELTRQLASIAYELLSGMSPTSHSRPLHEIRHQVPRAFSDFVQWALTSGTSRRGVSLSSVRKAFRKKTTRNSVRETILIVGILMLAVSSMAAFWWYSRPAVSQMTKADFAQQLGIVQQLQKRAEQQDATLTADAKSARAEIDKWEREFNAARQDDKQVQLEYAQQQLSEIRPRAEMQIELGRLWQEHRERSTWQAEISGLLTAAQSLAEDHQYDAAVEKLKTAETMIQSWLNWKQIAASVLSDVKSLNERIQHRQETVWESAFAWPKEQLTMVTDMLKSSDGQETLAVVQSVEQALSAIEDLNAKRESVNAEIQRTEQLVVIQQIRERRDASITKFKKGDTLFATGKYDECRETYQDVLASLVQLPVDAVEMLLDSAQRLRESKNRDACLTMLDQIVQLQFDSDDVKTGKVRAYLLRGELLTEQNDYSNAIEEYTLALNLDPRHLSALEARGDLYFQSQRNSEALKDFELALDIDEKSVRALLGKAAIDVSHGEYQEAATACDRVLNDQPDVLRAYNIRAVANYKLMRYDQVVADCTMLIENNDRSANVLAYRAEAHYELHNYEPAITDCDAALELNPEFSRCLRIRAKAFNQIGNKQKAREDYERALRLESETP